MIDVSKNVYFDVLDDIVHQYNNTYHRTLKIKPMDVKSDSYPKCNVDYNETDKVSSRWSGKNIKKGKHFCQSICS